MTTIYQLFCKTPVAGRVKTRLQLPETEALAVHLELTELAVHALARVVGDMQKAETGSRGEIWSYPDTAGDYLEAKREQGWDIYLQEGRDLGERMFNAIADGLGRAGQVLLFGADCPEIDGQYLALASEQLALCDLVLGPSEDGGYGLIGMKAAVPEVFQGIQWGSDSVLDETCRQASRQGLEYRLLPRIWDVDRPADLQRYQEWQRHRQAASRPQGKG